jgi:uncharacterized protein YuzE
MKITPSVNPETGHIGSIYVQLTDEPVAKTVPGKNPADPELLIDLDGKGELVGVEILASALMREFCDLISKGLPKRYANKVGELCRTV